MFINMLSWWQWLILAAIPPTIILLYFLKLKRMPLEVPSTYLWHKSIEDLHVNSIWQRLRQNILLFLQLLLVLTAMIAALRPGCRSYALSGDRFIFIVDNSASMQSTDTQPTRLDEAKRRVLGLIDQMSSGDLAMVISFNVDAQVVQEFTDNRRQLRRGVESIKPTPRTTALREALQLAAGLANPGRTATDDTDFVVADALPADVFIFSDGKFPNVDGFSLGNLTPTFVPIGDSFVKNVAITAFSTRRHESKPDQQQAFAQVENFTEEDATLSLNLYLDRELIDADEVEVKAKDTRGVAFDLGELDAGVLRLELKKADGLALDNTAYAVLNQPRRARVLLVSPGNDPLELALATDRAAQLAEVSLVAPDVLNGEDFQSDATSGRYDLMIFDQCAPKTMPQCNTLFIGKLPPSSTGWTTAEATVAAPQVIDVERAHPLMQMVDFDTVEIAEGQALQTPPGGTVLVDTNRGALAAIAPREGFEDAVLGFEIMGQAADGARYVNTNWPLRVSFPTFVLNTLEYLGGQQHGANALSAQPGQVVPLRSQSPVEQLEVEAPNGEKFTVTRGGQNAFQFTGTSQLGVYQVREGKQPLQQFAVNLFDTAESDIAPRQDKVQIGYVEVAGQAGWQAGRRETWKILLGVSLVVLLIEWYIYNRRVSL